MPHGIRSLKDQFGARLRPGANGLRAMAVGLLVLLLWAATLAPFALAATLPHGSGAQTVQIEHGGETPPTQEAPPALSSTRTTARLHLPAPDATLAVTAMPVTRASQRRRSPRRRRPSQPAPRLRASRRQQLGRAPPR